MVWPRFFGKHGCPMILAGCIQIEKIVPGRLTMAKSPAMTRSRYAIAMLNKFFYGLRRCQFEYKFPVLVLLAALITVTLYEGTSDSLRPISGLTSFAVCFLLGTVDV